VNLTQKYLHFLCLCYQSTCDLLLPGGICDCDVIVACILPRIYIFLELETISSYINGRDFAVIFFDFHKKCAVFLTVFCRDILLSLAIADYHSPRNATQRNAQP